MLVATTPRPRHNLTTRTGRLQSLSRKLTGVKFRCQARCKGRRAPLCPLNFSLFGMMSPTSQQQPRPTTFHVKAAQLQDYWHVADIHCDVFYPNAPAWAALLLRLDRVFSLQDDKQSQEQGNGQFAVLVASSKEDTEPGWMDCYKLPLPAPLSIIRALVQPAARPLVGSSYLEAGLLAALTVDTFGGKLPARFVSSLNSWDGRIGWEPRKGLAYVANVAVVELARRRGVARRLMQEAEALAASWGCRAITLHVDPANTAACNLYDQLGYRRAVWEPVWVPALMGRPSERRVIMMKLLRTST